MALVLSLREGQDFYVGLERFVVSKVHDPSHFQIRRDSTGEMFEATDVHAAEIMERVFVSAGKGARRPGLRIKIEAPPNTLVLRGDSYRKYFRQDRRRMH